jgi:purine-binding chemotaxis protein CheW
MSDKMQEIFQQQQEQNEPQADAEEVVQLVGFIVGDEEFAVPILSIQEIIKPLEYTRVPSTPDYVMGVFNMRGNVIPLIHLRMKFGLPYKKEDEDTRYIVIKEGEEVIGYVIDRLTEAVRMNESDIDPTPETLNESEDVIYGIGKKQDRIITVLKVEGLVNRSF